jgi:putative Holliday junction resolvase
MRILGIDPGRRRVGLAISDPLRLTAQGLDTVDLEGEASLLDVVSSLFERYDIGEIVVGNPVTQSGAISRSSQEARHLADELGRAFPVKVTLWDERYSSREAERILKGCRPEKGTIDKLAAVLILQSYLDFLGQSGASRREE